jgi:hypothetical protein
MIPNHDQFLQALQEKHKVWVKFYSPADHGLLEHVCAPLDYGPGTGLQDGLNRYWLWDYGNQPDPSKLGLLPQQIVDLQVLGQVFDPSNLVAEPKPAAAVDPTDPTIKDPVNPRPCTP